MLQPAPSRAWKTAFIVVASCTISSQAQGDYNTDARSIVHTWVLEHGNFLHMAADELDEVLVGAEQLAREATHHSCTIREPASTSQYHCVIDFAIAGHAVLGRRDTFRKYPDDVSFLRLAHHRPGQGW